MECILSCCRTTWRMVVIVILALLLPTHAAKAGKNAGGALIVHTNDAVTFSAGGDYCGTLFDDPGSCEAANTRTDKDENTPAVIWVLAAFPTGSSPAVTAVQFGLDDNIPVGNWAEWSACGPGVVEVHDEGWPETSKGTAFGFGSAVSDSLFPVYVFAVYGFAGADTAYLGTTNYPHGPNVAQFADDSSPPVVDDITRFGTVRWYAAGSNDCPPTNPQGGDSAELPDGDVPDNPGGSPPSPLAYVRLATQSDSACFAVARQLRVEYGLRIRAVVGPDGVFCRATDGQLNELVADPRVTEATRVLLTNLPPVGSGEPDDPIDTGQIWNCMLSTPPDTARISAASVCSPPPSGRASDTPENNPDHQTSVYMMREVGVQVIFPESSDNRPCDCAHGVFVENWTNYQKTLCMQSIVSGLADILVDQTIDNDLNFWFAQPITQTISEEPITLPSTDTSWVEAVFAALGYGSGSHIERGYAYDNARRSALGTDWYYTCFFVDNECDRECGDGLFADGYRSYAYALGPYNVILYNSSGTSMEYTTAHETCHVFGAADEYAADLGEGDCMDSGSCDDEYGYLHVPNRNCYFCTGEQAPCIMNTDAYGAAMCHWTKGQIGWWDYDSDGAFDPIDHPNAGKFMRLGTSQHPLSSGDRIVIRDVQSYFIKTLAVGYANADGGKTVWDGVNYTGVHMPSGTYYWSKNGVDQGAIPLLDDVAAPTLSNVNVIVNNDPDLPQHLQFEFTDNDTYGCDVRARTHFHGMTVPLMDQMRDEFIFHTAGGPPVDRIFYVDSYGDYDMDMFIWDVGGGHNATATVPFRVGTSADAGEIVYIPEIRIGPGTPNPAGEWTKWRVDGAGGPVGSIEVVGIDGRCIRSWKGKTLPQGATSFLWDGRTNDGRRAAAGKYFLRITNREGRATVSSVTLVR